MNPGNTPNSEPTGGSEQSSPDAAVFDANACTSQMAELAAWITADLESFVKKHAAWHTTNSYRQSMGR